MARDWPISVLTLTIWVYWSTVFLLVFYKRIRHGHSAGVFPRHRSEKRLWWGVGLVFLLWNTLPYVAASLEGGLFGLPTWATTVPALYTLRSVSAVLAVTCYLMTLSCWIIMGRNWSMAIVPNQKTDLVTGGLFGWVRHPIYSLSILLMLCTAVTVATVPMLLVALLHITIMNIKASKEERHLTQQHGSSYSTYCQKVGRFVPRFREMATR